MKKHDTKPLAAIVGATLVTGLSAGAAQAAENPFALKELASGYAQVAEAEAAKDKPAAGEMKCGAEMMKNNPEMKCGAGMMKMEDKPKDQKAMEGKCAGMKMEGAPAAPPAPPAK
jgi:uncharacterized low-complexity protein